MKPSPPDASKGVSALRGAVRPDEARRWFLIAVGVFLLTELIFSIVSIHTRQQPLQRIVLWNALISLPLRWGLPFGVVFLVEKRGLESLGLAIPTEKIPLYITGALAALILPALVLSYDPYWPVEFLEQVVYIGLLEEFFYRGYLQRRWGEYLGPIKGLLGASLVFALGHIIARLADHGLGALGAASTAGVQALMGGLIFGGIYLKTKNIWPSAILHVASNMYFSAFVGWVSG